MDVRELVAWNLRRIRVLRDLSQEKLGADADVDRTYVGRLERCLENPTIGVLERLAAALDVHISEFFKQPKSGEPAPRPLRSGRRAQVVRRAAPPSRSKTHRN
jgi:transcriptional regulator with XRE-family HTH domain